MSRGFHVPVMNALYKTIFQAYYQLVKLSPQRHEPWTCNVTNKCSFQDHLLCNIIISNQWAQSPMITCRGFPVCPFQDHLQSKPTVSMWWTLSPWRPEKYAEASLCQWWMPFMRTSSELSYHMDSMNSASPDTEQWTCTGFPSVTNIWPFQDLLPSNPNISTQWAWSPGRPE